MALEPTANTGDMNVVQFRFERGDSVVGTDGLLGRVEQIVVERETRELRSLIVRASDSGREIELPANLIVRTLEHQVELGISGADLARHPELAAPYDPNDYVPVFEGTHVGEATAGRTSAETDRPVVTDVEPNAAELVSARPEIAPEGEIESIAANGTVIPANTTAPVTAGDGQATATQPDVIVRPVQEDRVVEPPQVVPAPTPGENLMAREAPPTPTDRQLPREGETSAAPSEEDNLASPELGVGDIGDIDEVEDIELAEQIEPFFITDEDLAPTTGVPWGPILMVLGLTAVGVAGVASVVLWRMRERAKRQAAAKAAGAGLRFGGWRMKRNARHTMDEAGEKMEDALDAMRDGAQHTRDMLADALNAPIERLRWFQRGARTGRQVEAKKKAVDLARITARERLARARDSATASLIQAKTNAASTLGQAKANTATSLAQARAGAKESLDRTRANADDVAAWSAAPDDVGAEDWYDAEPLADAADVEDLDIRAVAPRAPGRAWLIFRPTRALDNSQTPS